MTRPHALGHLGPRAGGRILLERLRRGRGPDTSLWQLGPETNPALTQHAANADFHRNIISTAASPSGDRVCLFCAIRTPKYNHHQTQTNTETVRPVGEESSSDSQTARPSTRENHGRVT